MQSHLRWKGETKMNSARSVMLFLLALSSMAQTLPRPAGPYFEPISDWPSKAGIEPHGIVIAPGDEIIPQIANSGTPQDGGYFMIFQASNVSTETATFTVNFYDGNGASMSMPLATSPDDLIGRSASGFRGTLSPGGYGAQVTIPNGSPAVVGYAVVTMDPAESVAGNATFVNLVPGRPPFMAGVPPVERPSQDGLHAVPGSARAHSVAGFGVAGGSGCDTDRP